MKGGGTVVGVWGRVREQVSGSTHVDKFRGQHSRMTAGSVTVKISAPTDQGTHPPINQGTYMHPIISAAAWGPTPGGRTSSAGQRCPSGSPWQQRAPSFRPASTQPQQRQQQATTVKAAVGGRWGRTQRADTWSGPGFPPGSPAGATPRCQRDSGNPGPRFAAGIQ